MFVHGGLSSSKQSGQPLSSLVMWNVSSNAISEVDTGEDAPCLSHHTANMVGEVMVLTGGWDGKNRSSKVHAFNLATSQWLNLQHLEDISRPPFGLSGHSCTRIKSSLFCVLGREGGLKIQRRFGDIFLLHLNIDPAMNLGTYFWKEAPIKTKSRSGHTAILAPSLKFGGDLYGLFVFGGRDDESIHKCGQWKADEVDLEDPAYNDQTYDDLCRTVDGLETCKPTALRYHTMISVHRKCVVVFGGENFKSRNNINSHILVCLFSEGVSRWYSLETEDGRSAHCMVSLPNGIYTLCGKRGNNTLSNICKLILKK